MKKAVFLLIAGLFFGACSAPKSNSVEKQTAFDSFIRKEKFLEDTVLFYPGIADPAMRPVLTAKINEIAADFKSLFLKGNATEKDFLRALDKGISTLPGGATLNTEDRERVATYLEELLEIADTRSSDGRLNRFVYGLNP